MTPKERMLAALHLKKPDRLPATIHQWQDYHLKNFMGGVDALDAYKICGLDASIQYWGAMGQFRIPDAEKFVVSVPDWRDGADLVDSNPLHRVVHHTVTTPKGVLTYKTEANDRTTWITEYLIKRPQDVELIDKHMPVARLSKEAIAMEYDASETLWPPGVGGNIDDPPLVRDFFGGRMAMIGGMDQFNVLTTGTHAQIRSEVHRLFEGFGRDGGTVMSASDPIFDTPVENLRVFGEAAGECGY